MLSLKKIYATIVVSMAGDVFWIQGTSGKWKANASSHSCSMFSDLSIMKLLLTIMCVSVFHQWVSYLGTGNQNHLLFKNVFTDILSIEFFYIPSAETQHMPLLTARESSKNESSSFWAFQIQLIRGKGGCEGLCANNRRVYQRTREGHILIFVFVGLFLYVSK